AEATGAFEGRVGAPRRGVVEGLVNALVVAEGLRFGATAVLVASGAVTVPLRGTVTQQRLESAGGHVRNIDEAIVGEAIAGDVIDHLGLFDSAEIGETIHRRSKGGGGRRKGAQSEHPEAQGCFIHSRNNSWGDCDAEGELTG